MSALLETPDYHALHAETQLDDFAAQIAALHFGDGLAKAKPKPEDVGKPEKPGDMDAEMKAALAAGCEPAGKGPIIITLDESGSMRTKIDAAKGLALALAWIAKQQKRWCALVAYSGGTGERVLALPPGRRDDGKLCEWLVDFMGGGSDIDVPIAELPRMYADLKPPVGQTDVIMITDAICRLPAVLVDRFNAWRKEAKARVISLILESAPGDLAKVSDECHQVHELAAGELAVGRVLAI